MLETIKRYLRYTSWPIIAAMVALMIFGLLAIRVAERAEATPAGYAQKQAIFACAALVAFVVMTMVLTIAVALVMAPALCSSSFIIVFIIGIIIVTVIIILGVVIVIISG